LHQADGGKGVRDLLRQAGTEPEASEETAVSGEEFGDRIRKVEQFRSQMLSFMALYDLIICPTNANVALKHGTSDEHFAGFSYTATYNITGWPGAVVRAGTSSDGLPIGVQIVGRPWREDVVLAVAQFVEDVFGGWQPPAL
jgi:amidase